MKTRPIIFKCKKCGWQTAFKQGAAFHVVTCGNYPVVEEKTK